MGQSFPGYLAQGLYQAGGRAAGDKVVMSQELPEGCGLGLL